MSTMMSDAENRSLREQVGTGPLLLAALRRIDDEGWDGRAGRTVLEYARIRVVRPVVRSVGFTGMDAEFAEATGWEAAWEVLQGACVRGAASPWGIVNAAVRQAVLGERLAETYGTSVRSAWRIYRFHNAKAEVSRTQAVGWKSVADPGALVQPASLTALRDEVEFDRAEVSPTSQECGPRVELIIGLLVRHGWQPEVARAAVAHVAEHARRNPASGRPRAHGWQEMSAELGIPTWQTRRVTVLLLGAPDWPGLLERMVTGGEAALAGPVVEAAVRSTCNHRMRPPAQAALTVAVDALQVAS